MGQQIAVILLQMGGADSLESIEPFLANLFSDRDIIRLGPSWLQPLLSRFIARRRTRKVEGYYRKIGGRSPIRPLTEAQADAVEDRLGSGYRCFVAMRYSKPDSDEAVAAIRGEGIDRVIALPLYPHYSRATTGSSINELKRAVGRAGNSLKLSFIDSYHDHPLYIDALAEKITEALAGFQEGGEPQILFTAHGLPQSFITSGDPYLDQISATVTLVMQRFAGIKHHLAFQSRAGPVKWLEPSTEATIRALAHSGCRELLMVPISFVSDHIETLYEIDIQYREEALSHGITDFRRTEALNSSPLFIRCLADLVTNGGEKNDNR